MIIDLGIIDYEAAYRIQMEFVARRRLGETGDSIIICEHPPVFTIGRSGNIANLLVSESVLRGRGIKVLAVDRGGDITVHAPGQIVLYPVMDLRPGRMDLHKHLRLLEEAAIRFLSGYGVRGERIAGRTGVWAEGQKIASIGIGSRGWITFHGMSVNVNIDLDFFLMIRPCGIDGITVTSLERLLGKHLDMAEAKSRLLSAACGVLRPEGIKDECAAVSAMD